MMPDKSIRNIDHLIPNLADSPSEVTFLKTSIDAGPMPQLLGKSVHLAHRFSSASHAGSQRALPAPKDSLLVPKSEIPKEFVRQEFSEGIGHHLQSKLTQRLAGYYPYPRVSKGFDQGLQPVGLRHAIIIGKSKYGGLGSRYPGIEGIDLSLASFEEVSHLRGCLGGKLAHNLSRGISRIIVNCNDLIIAGRQSLPGQGLQRPLQVMAAIPGANNHRYFRLSDPFHPLWHDAHLG